MHFNLITIFPELVENYVSHGIIAKAIEAKKLSIMTWNPREFSADKNKRIDEKPYGGGPGMILQPDPIIKTVEAIKRKDETYVICMAPHGKVLNQQKLLLAQTLLATFLQILGKLQQPFFQEAKQVCLPLLLRSH